MLNSETLEQYGLTTTVYETLESVIPETLPLYSLQELYEMFLYNRDQDILKNTHYADQDLEHIKIIKNILSVNNISEENYERYVDMISNEEYESDLLDNSEYWDSDTYDCGCCRCCGCSCDDDWVEDDE